MALKESKSPALSGWPDHEQLAELEDGPTMLILPDRVSELDKETVVSFREDAQAFRVRGREAGLRVDLVAPDGAKLGIYREHAAEWVLPVVAFLSLLARSAARPARGPGSSMDHIVPMADGGRFLFSNLRWSCSNCQVWHAIQAARARRERGERERLADLPPHSCTVLVRTRGTTRDVGGDGG